MKKIGFFLWLFVCFILSNRVFAATLQEIRLASNTPSTMRFVAELSSEVNPKVFRLSNPERLIIDFPKSSFSSQLKANPPNPSGFIGGIRIGTQQNGTARVVLDLPQFSLTEKHFLLKPQGDINWRFVLDLSQNITTSAVSATGSLKPFTTSTKPTKKVVVIDAGHGGQDPGAISRSGHYEKNITLNMAKELRDSLQKAGFKVVLTREKDIFIPLRSRIRKAHEAKGDLFISIHADSAKSTSARGLSVYTISERASDAEAAALAERENKADIILGMDLSDVDPVAGNVLLDLQKTVTMNLSAQYATLLVREMKKIVQLVPNAHRMAGFVVLKSPNIPSVLIELGYLSNKTEDKNLQSKAYRQKLANAITLAIKAYFNNLAE